MAITLDFTDVGYDIFINIFQSNNYSSYHLDPAIDVGHARIDAMRYNVDAAGAIYSTTLPTGVSAQGEPLEYEANANWSGEGYPIGHILAFCRDYYVPSGRLTGQRKVLIVPNAVGGTGYQNSNFESGVSGGNGWGICGSIKSRYHERTIVRANAALAAAPGSVIKAFFCQGGEADGFYRAGRNPFTGATTTMYEDLETAGPSGAGVYATFKDYTIAMVADFRARLPGGASIPFLFGQMSPAYQDPAPLGSTRAIEDVASYVSNAISIPSAGLTTQNWKTGGTSVTDDVYYQAGNPYLHNVHYDAPSQRGGTEHGMPVQTNPLSKRYWTGYQTLVP